MTENQLEQEALGWLTKLGNTYRDRGDLPALAAVFDALQMRGQRRASGARSPGRRPGHCPRWR